MDQDAHPFVGPGADYATHAVHFAQHSERPLDSLSLCTSEDAFAEFWLAIFDKISDFNRSALGDAAIAQGPTCPELTLEYHAQMVTSLSAAREACKQFLVAYSAEAGPISPASPPPHLAAPEPELSPSPTPSPSTTPSPASPPSLD